MFSGTLRDSIVYGNDEYQDYCSAQLAEVLESAKLSTLLARFPEDDTKVASSGNSISLGPKQTDRIHACDLAKTQAAIAHPLNNIDNWTRCTSSIRAEWRWPDQWSMLWTRGCTGAGES
jgi:ABC-type uncharacterized transport system fused permease/ATPase subunit